MIIIKTIDDNNAELLVDKGTKHTTILLGIEMLVEILMKESSADFTIDMLLNDIKYTYLRDNRGDKNE